MTIKLRIAWGAGSDPTVMRMAAWSAVGHVIVIVVFSLLPRFTTPVAPPHATIAEIVPASALFSAPPGGGKTGASSSAPVEPPEETPSQRAEAAREAAKPAPKPPKEAPKEKKPAPSLEPPRTTKKKPALEPEPPRSARDDAETRHDASPEASDDASQSPARSGKTPPGGAAGDSGITFGGGPGPGGIPSIGSSAFPYDYYRASLVAILQSNWRRPVAPDGLRETVTCRVQFTILKTGIVQDPRVVQASGNEALDQSALRAVYNSNPLPPLPFQYGQSSVSAEVVFELTPD